MSLLQRRDILRTEQAGWRDEAPVAVCKGNHHYPTHTIFDAHIYAVVSAMVFAVYDVQLTIRRKKPAEVEPEQTEDAIAS